MKRKEPTTSTIPTNKEELSKAITQAFKKLLVDYESVPEEYSRTSGVEGNIKHTEISVCDTLSYLIGWGELVLKWQFRISQGLPVDFPETGYKWNEIGKLAQHFHAKYQPLSYEELIAEFELTTNHILALIESLTNDELYGSNWYKNYTLGRMIQFNTSSPMKNIRSKVRRFNKANEIK
jgi:hypothetical protein